MDEILENRRGLLPGVTMLRQGDSITLAVGSISDAVAIELARAAAVVFSPASCPAAGDQQQPQGEGLTVFEAGAVEKVLLQLVDSVFVSSAEELGRIARSMVLAAFRPSGAPVQGASSAVQGTSQSPAHPQVSSQESAA